MQAGVGDKLTKIETEDGFELKRYDADFDAQMAAARKVMTARKRAFARTGQIAVPQDIGYGLRSMWLSQRIVSSSPSMAAVMACVILLCSKARWSVR